MTQAAKKLLDEFEVLPEEDRAEVVAEILRRTAFAPHDLPKVPDVPRARLQLDRALQDDVMKAKAKAKDLLEFLSEQTGNRR